MSYLPKGLPEPVTETDKLDLPYWQGTRAGKLMVQRCGACNTFQWGPEWLCHECRSWDMKWVQVEGQGKIWTWTRCWHPVHAALKGFGPYIATSLVKLTNQPSFSFSVVPVLPPTKCASCLIEAAVPRSTTPSRMVRS